MAQKAFWIDNQARQEVDKVKALLEADVPFYDRGYTLGSNSVDGSSGHGGYELYFLYRICNGILEKYYFVYEALRLNICAFVHVTYFI